MNSERYQELALRTAKDMGSYEKNLIHAALGLASDSGEFVDAIKKHVIYGKELDFENCIEELGDIIWFIVLACKTLEIELGQVMQANIKKLALRYPKGYSDFDAVLRSDKLNQIKE